MPSLQENLCQELHCAIVVVKIFNTYHHRSPLVQGGLELPIQVIVKMEYSPQTV